MIVIGLVALFLIALGLRRTVGDAGDLAAAIADLSARRLASARPGWGRAMAAELSALDDRRTRLRFALGCARTALVPPLADGNTASGVRFAIIAVVGAVIGLGIVVQRRAQAAPALGRHGASYEVAVTALFLALIALHAWLVDRRARETSARAAAARRSGITVGIFLGVGALLLSLPLPGASSSRVSTVAAVLPFPLMLVGCVLTGVMAARASGDSASGHEAGVWAGRVAGSILAIGLLAATVWASGWFAHDPATISQYRETFSPEHFASYHTHFRTIVGFVSSENIDTALISVLLLFPLIGFVFGALGGRVGPPHPERSHNP